MKSILIQVILVFFYCSGYSQDIPDDMINFYPFSGNANDEGGNGYDGNVNGAILAIDRCNIDNSAFYFDGGSDFINIGDINNYDGSQALTISAWIFTDGIIDEHSGTIISKYSTFGESERVFLFDVNRYRGNALRFIMYGADGGADWEQATTDIPLVLSRWNHVVVTWDGAMHSISFYINGKKVSSSFEQNGNPPSRIYNKSSDLMIGASEAGYSSPDYFFSGSIDEVLTYTRVLTQEEILGLYYYNCDHSELLAYYPFNGNAKEEYGSGNDGVVSGPVLTTDRCGYPNSAYLFDGINDRISLDPSFITPFSKGTFAAWVYFNSLNSTQYLGCIGDLESQDHYLSLIRFDPIYDRFTIFRRNPGSADIMVGSTPVELHKWYFVVMTSDDDEWNLYVNAEKETLTILGHNSGDWASDINGADNWLLGCIDIQEPHDPAYLNGKLDDIRVYDYALTFEEIQSLYNYNCMLAISGQTEVCQAQKDVIYAAPYIDDVIYTWDYSGTGVSLNGNYNEIRMDFSDSSTNGNLEVTASRNDVVVGSSVLNINVFELPGIPGNITGPAEVCVNEGPYYFSTPDIENAEEYIWNYNGDGMDISDNSNSIIAFFNANATSGILTVKALNPCGQGPESMGLNLTVKQCNDIDPFFNIPNSFSPNGDNINDTYFIQGLPQNTSIQIFNRAGKLLYKSDCYLNDWDGVDLNGEKLSSGTYWYIIKMPGLEAELKGFVYLKE